MKTIDVPILSVDTFAVPKPSWEFEIFLGNTTAENFTRPIMFDYYNPLGGKNLSPFENARDLFKQTDTHLEHIADVVGAIVVPHTFGFIETTQALEASDSDSQRTYIQDLNGHYSYYHDDLLPKGYILGASVSLVINDGNQPPHNQITQSYLEYVMQQRNTSPHYLRDINRPDQFVSGHLADCISPTSLLYIVDIEPRYSHY